MANTPGPPPPRGAAAFKARRAAYELRASLAEEVEAVRFWVDSGRWVQAAKSARRILTAIHQNPEAERLIRTHEPHLLSELRAAERAFRPEPPQAAGAEVIRPKFGQQPSVA